MSGSDVLVRVAILDHTAQTGGAELAVLRLMDALAQRDDVEAHVILFSAGPLVDLLRERGHTVEVLPLDPTLGAATRDEVAGLTTALRSAVAAAPLVMRLAARLRDLDVDVVHTTSLKADVLGVPAARLARRPLVWHVHDRIAPDYLPRALVRLVRRVAHWGPDKIVANSRATAETLPGVDVTVAHPGLVPEQIGVTPRPLPTRQVVGLLGRISPTKGQLELVRAAAQVVHREHVGASWARDRRSKRWTRSWRSARTDPTTAAPPAWLRTRCGTRTVASLRPPPTLDERKAQPGSSRSRIACWMLVS